MGGAGLEDSGRFRNKGKIVYFDPIEYIYTSGELNVSALGRVLTSEAQSSCMSASCLTTFSPGCLSLSAWLSLKSCGDVQRQGSDTEKEAFFISGMF